MLALDRYPRLVPVMGLPLVIHSFTVQLVHACTCDEIVTYKYVKPQVQQFLNERRPPDRPL
jgi:hypothetical protein